MVVQADDEHQGHDEEGQEAKDADPLGAPQHGIGDEREDRDRCDRPEIGKPDAGGEQAEGQQIDPSLGDEGAGERQAQAEHHQGRHHREAGRPAKPQVRGDEQLLRARIGRRLQASEPKAERQVEESVDQRHPEQDVDQGLALEVDQGRDEDDRGEQPDIDGYGVEIGVAAPGGREPVDLRRGVEGREHAPQDDAVLPVDDADDGGQAQGQQLEAQGQGAAVGAGVEADPPLVRHERDQEGHQRDDCRQPGQPWLRCDAGWHEIGFAGVAEGRCGDRLRSRGTAISARQIGQHQGAFASMRPPDSPVRARRRVIKTSIRSRLSRCWPNPPGRAR